MCETKLSIYHCDTFTYIIRVGFPGAQILSFDEDKVEEVDYKSTSSYQTMKLFLDRYDYFVKDIQENNDGGIL